MIGRPIPGQLYLMRIGDKKEIVRVMHRHRVFGWWVERLKTDVPVHCPSAMYLEPWPDSPAPPKKPTKSKPKRMRR